MRNRKCDTWLNDWYCKHRKADWNLLLLCRQLQKLRKFVCKTCKPEPEKKPKHGR